MSNPPAQGPRMKKGRKALMRICHKKRHYVEQSSRFTHITGSAGFTGLHGYILVMGGILETLKEQAERPCADMGILVKDMERVTQYTRLLDANLSTLWNSCIRYLHACEESYSICPPPMPRFRDQDKPFSQWGRRSPHPSDDPDLQECIEVSEEGFS
jgi:hypothetical protein